jgi:O-6-methylguanine DNA methyltransferase
MEPLYYASLASSFLQEVFVASTGTGVCMINFLTSEAVFVRDLEAAFHGEPVRDERKNKDVLGQLRRYFQGTLQQFTCPLDLRGTPFQLAAWQALTKIPYGETRAYREIAREIGHPNAARAVGSANGANRIPLIVPCHRVIESNGKLGGFGQGLDAKRALLAFEQAHRK